MSGGSLPIPGVLPQPKAARSRCVRDMLSANRYERLMACNADFTTQRPSGGARNKAEHTVRPIRTLGKQQSASERPCRPHRAARTAAASPAHATVRVCSTRKHAVRRRRERGAGLRASVLLVLASRGHPRSSLQAPRRHLHCTYAAENSSARPALLGRKGLVTSFQPSF